MPATNMAIVPYLVAIVYQSTFVQYSQNKFEYRNGCGSIKCSMAPPSTSYSQCAKFINTNTSKCVVQFSHTLTSGHSKNAFSKSASSTAPAEANGKNRNIIVK